MLKEHQYIFGRVNMAIDFVLTALSVVLAHLARNWVIAPYLFPQVFREPARFTDYAWLSIVMPFLMVGFLTYNRYYASQRVRTMLETSRTVLFSAIETSVASMVLAFFLTQRATPAVLSDIVTSNLSRGVILLVPFILTILILLKTLIVRRFLMKMRQSGKNWRSLLLVGSGENLRHFIQLVQNHPFWGFKLVGVVDDSGRESLAVEGVNVIGGLGDFWETVKSMHVDEVVFIPGKRSLTELTPYFEGCEEMGLKTRVPLNFFQNTIARPVLDTFQDVPVITYSPVREMNSALLFKYTFDRVAALLFIILFSPLIVLCAILVKLTSESWSDPIFYGQVRSGLNGKPFTLWKFRSMKVNAEKELDRLRELNEMEGPVFKIREDPRITTVGKWIRKLSIDELPQLWNVLRGDMSLVGPRPPIPSEVSQYDRWQRRRLSMKPGITCLWQVSGRNHLSFETWMKLDLEYIDNWSLFLDFKILCRTIYVVATGYGAM